MLAEKNPCTGGERVEASLSMNLGQVDARCRGFVLSGYTRYKRDFHTPAFQQGPIEVDVADHDVRADGGEP